MKKVLYDCPQKEFRERPISETGVQTKPSHQAQRVQPGIGIRHFDRQAEIQTERGNIKARKERVDIEEKCTTERERERERQRRNDRQTEKDKERDRERGRHNNKGIERQRERGRERNIQRMRQ